jgi:glycosyltransferase involved in cell wall biosynthesis
MMRILMAIGVPRQREGGAAGIMMNYADGLERRGHRITRLFLDDVLPQEHRAGRFADVRFAAEVAKHVLQRQKDYSIVNIHAPAGFLYGLARRALVGAQPAYVTTVTGLPESRMYAMKREARKGHAWHFAWHNRMWHRLYHASIHDCSVRTADAATCYSRDVWNILRLRFDFDDDRVVCVPNGVAEAFFVDREHHGRAQLRMLFVGSWLDQRGIYYLREALPGVFARLPDARFTFAGPGVPADDIRRFFGESLSRHLDILGKVAWQEMPQLYAAHDILVFPSLLEGQPCVILEAMASGMPVITAETCGMVDVIEHGVDGLLLPPGDGAALEAAILWLGESPSLRETMGHAARARMSRRTWDGAALRLETLFRHVIGRAPEGAT